MKESKWFAVHTRPKWEKRVIKSLSRRQIEAYCPLNKSDQPWNDRNKTGWEPLFASCVFICADEKQQLAVAQTRGVISFVYWHEKPAIIRNEEIDAIRLFLNEYPSVKLEKAPVNITESVRVINGPQMVRKGNVLEVRSNFVEIKLPSLGYVLLADVRKESVENGIYQENISMQI